MLPSMTGVASAVGAVARASLKRGLSAVAAAAPAEGAFPTNVTLPAPSDKGPVNLPRVWKRKPGAPGVLLYERTPKEMLKNLQYLAGSPHGAPRPEPLHRLLLRVRTPEDLELAVKGLNTLRNSRTVMGVATATLFAEAAVAAGKPGVAVDLFARGPKATGLAPAQSSFVPLVFAAGDSGDAALLKSITSTLWAAGVDGAPTHSRLASLLVRAHIKCGNLEGAVRLYNKVRRLAPGDEGWGREHRPAVNILVAAAQAAKGAPAGDAPAPAEGADAAKAAPPTLTLSPALATLIRRTVLADCVGPTAKQFATWAPKDGSAPPVPRAGVAEAAALADAALPAASAAAPEAEAAGADATAAAAAPAEAKA